ncbi:glycine-rich RNA-binding protein 4, mitochondrial [Tanacetum coccineum]
MVVTQDDPLEKSKDAVLDEAITRATEWTNKSIIAERSTNLLRPLKQAFDMVGKMGESIPLIFLITDGRRKASHARVITNKESVRSRGFGFINYDTDESANEAMKAMDGQLNHQSIRVSLATERIKLNELE